MQSTRTVRDFLTQALKLIGVVADGNKATDWQLNDTLYHLNLIKDSWSTSGAMIYTMTTLVAPLANGVAQSDGTTVYTIGPVTGNVTPSIVVAARPQYLEFAAFRLSSSGSSLDLPMTVLSDGEWASIRVKGITTNIPRAIYLDGTWPIGNIHLWGQTGGGSLLLQYWQGFNTNTGLNDVVQFPPGYERAFLLDTAISVAPSFDKSPSPTLSAQLASIKRDLGWTNIRSSRLQYPGEAQGVRSGGAYDILSDSVL